MPNMTVEELGNPDDEPAGYRQLTGSGLTCLRCGATVAITDPARKIHDDWHVKVDQVIRRVRGDG